VRWTYSLPEGQVDIRALPNDDAERVAWLRGDSPSATSEEEVGQTLSFFYPVKHGEGDFPLYPQKLQPSLHNTYTYPVSFCWYKNVFHYLWPTMFPDLTKDERACLQLDWNPLLQLPSSRYPTPYTARPPTWALQMSLYCYITGDICMPVVYFYIIADNSE